MGHYHDRRCHLHSASRAQSSRRRIARSHRSEIAGTAVIEQTPLLEVGGLGVAFGKRRPISAVTDVSFSLARGEVLGLIGESGSGKTVTGLALLRLLPNSAHCSSSLLRYGGKDIANLDARGFDALRGRE